MSLPRAVKEFIDKLSRKTRYGHYPEDATAEELFEDALTHPDSPFKRVIEAAERAWAELVVGINTINYVLSMHKAPEHDFELPFEEDIYRMTNDRERMRKKKEELEQALAALKEVTDGRDEGRNA